MNVDEWQKRILKGPLLGNETEADSREQGEDCPLTAEGGPTEQDNCRGRSKRETGGGVKL